MILGTTVVVGNTKVVVVAVLLGVVTAGAEVGAGVEGTAVVDVDVEVGRVKEVEFVAIALGSLLAALEQAALPSASKRSPQIVINLIFGI